MPRASAAPSSTTRRNERVSPPPARDLNCHDETARATGSRSVTRNRRLAQRAAAVSWSAPHRHAGTWFASKRYSGVYSIDASAPGFGFLRSFACSRRSSAFAFLTCARWSPSKTCASPCPPCPACDVMAGCRASAAAIEDVAHLDEPMKKNVGASRTSDAHAAASASTTRSVRMVTVRGGRGYAWSCERAARSAWTKSRRGGL
mmetsp:Transcript_4169/g.11907  ORF Transcript_4169/g.11907 Transcript_4169/m.11907 type:complete len:203 (-) Transcript_4169:244-852(-)